MKQVIAKIESAKVNNASLLSLPEEGLTEIPQQVFELSHLTNLNLRGNKIKCIPSEIARLHNLKVLYLDNNQIEQIEAGFFDLKHIEVLSLDNNKIYHLPEEIGNFKKLRRLSSLPQRLSCQKS